MAHVISVTVVRRLMAVIGVATLVGIISATDISRLQLTHLSRISSMAAIGAGTMRVSILANDISRLQQIPYLSPQNQAPNPLVHLVWYQSPYVLELDQSVW